MARRSFGARIGTRLRARREALGWSQAKLAEAVGMSPNYIGILERGLKLPTIDTLVKLGKKLGVDVGRLLAQPAKGDDWLDDVITVASSMPRERRGVALAVLKAVAQAR